MTRYDADICKSPERAALMNNLTYESLLTPSQVAAMFKVDPKTVTRWAKAGKLSSIRTLGGHRRYKETEVRLLLEGQRAPGNDPA